MPWTMLCLSQHIQHTLFHYIPRGQQERRIEVALDTPLVANPRPGIVERHAPIDADDIATRLSHQLQEAGGPGAKVD